MKCGCKRRACARSICSRISAIELRIHTLGGQLAFGDEFFNRVDIDCAVDLSEKFGFYLGSIAITDGIDEEVAQSVPFEQFAKHIVDLAAKRGPRLLQLFEQPPINLTLARVCGA